MDTSKTVIISNWYSSADIDYLAPFMKLWVSFNCWYNIALSNPKDREAIDWLKINQDLQGSLRNILRLNSDEGKDFRKALSNLIEETRNQPLINNKNKNVLFLKSDITKQTKEKYLQYRKQIKDTDAKIEEQTLEDFTYNNDGIILDDDSTVIITNDSKQILNEIIEVIYQVRCQIFHGLLDTQDKRTQRLVKNSYICLINLFKPGMTGV